MTAPFSTTGPLGHSTTLPVRDLVFFSLLAGTVATFIHGYYYCLGNHIEQLPQVFRVLDPSYLANDFQVNATAPFGPRSFYVYLLGWLGRIIPLPALFLVLTVLQNAAVALVSGLVARKISGGSGLAAIAAGALVMSVDSIHLGEAAYLRLPALIPASLITALALLAVWEGIRGRPIAAALVSIPAALIHPLLGLEAGIVGTSTAFVSSLLGIGDARPLRERRPGLVRALVGAVIVTAVAAVFMFGSQGRQILTSRQLIDIYGHFRAPHHIIPSAFPLKDWLAALAFLAAFGVSWAWWYRRPGADRGLALRLLVPVCIVLLLWFGGWFFVEVVPSRLWAVMQTFRLNLFIKWLGLLLFAVTIAELARPMGLALYAACGYIQPFVGLGVHLVELARRRLRPAALRLILAVLLLAAEAWALYRFRSANSFREGYALVAFALVAVAMLYLRRAWLRYGISIGVAAAAVILPMAARPGSLFTRPVFTLEQGNDPADPVSLFCRDNTPEEAIFIAPPQFGRFRLVARRALVADFKYAMPHDWAIIEWRRRLTDMYGDVEQRGFAAAGEMEWNYRRIPEMGLVWLARKYEATHAVLYRDTPCEFPLLYADRAYKVVQIPVY